MIKLAGITSHNSDLASSYASTYSMVEKNLTNQKSQLLPGASPSQSQSYHQNQNDSNNKSDNEDQTRPKKIRLPSISSIASSLHHPISHTNEQPVPQFQTTPQQHQQSSPSYYNQRAHSNPELNKLRLAADIFTKEQNQQSQQPQPQPQPSNVSSPMVQHQHPTLYQIPPQPIQQFHQVPTYPQQYHQLAPPPAVQQGTAFPHHQFPPQQQQQPPMYFATSEQFPHYTTAAAPQLTLQHQIKPKRNYTRRLSKFQQENKLKPQLYCQRCGITETPEWRKGPNGARTLCNACGLFHAKILKRDGPEAAANAINSNKIIKKNHFKRRSSVNDTQLLNAYQHQHQHQQAIPNQIPNQIPHHPGSILHHPQQVQLLPPPNQIFHQQPGQPNSTPQRVISLPPGVQPIMTPQGIPSGFISHPGSGAPTPTHHQIPHPQQASSGVVLSPISPQNHEQNR